LTGVAEILKPFDEVTTDLSPKYYSSISKVFSSIQIIQHGLEAIENIEANCPF
jgi:hypothetical protein